MADAESGTRESIMRLCCALVGGTELTVNVSGDISVHELKKAIKSEMAMTLRDVDAAELDLYPTKLSDTSNWLSDTDVTERVALEAAINVADPHGNATLKPIKASRKIQTVFGGAPDEDVIHVLVKVPSRMLEVETKEEDEKIAESVAKRQRVDVPEWKWKGEEEKEPVYCLTDSAMFFVNRDHATEQLLHIHKLKYNRAVKPGGVEWEIPIVDNVFGIGKSTFGDEYIRKCRKEHPGLADANAKTFLPVLCACHTIHIVLPSGSLLAENYLESSKIEKNMIELICDFFDMKFASRPRALAPELVESMRSSEQLLTNLTAEVGPVFIVLDEIGQGFDSPYGDIDDFGKREQFLKFCRLVLLNWLSLPKVFFLIAGRASFLSYVGRRPETMQKEIDASSVKFRRLSLQLLRSEAIEQIINRTFFDEVEMKTIKEHFCLDDEQVTRVAEHLFNITFGHPRSLIAAFSKCQSYDQLIACDVSDVSDQPDCIDWTAFAERMQSYAEPLDKMMSCAIKAETVNLTQIWKDKGNKEISYDSIANSLGIAWERTVEEAILYMPPYFKQLILAFLYPLKEYLDKVASCEISADYPAVFEWACLKRFQELFGENSQKCPHKVLPEFFTDQQRFGACTEVQFAKRTRPMPKITDRGNQEPSLDTQTASPEKWPILMTEIDKVLTKEHRLTLKPLPKSSSSDAILMTMMQTTKLTVGIAAKNYAGRTPFGKTLLKEECTKFNRMFDTSDGRLNILIVCSTNYSSELEKEFEVTDSEGRKIDRDSAVYSIDGFPNIHEIILLNLSKREQRAKFFGIQDEARRKALESIIEKAEVEFHSKE